MSRTGAAPVAKQDTSLNDLYDQIPFLARHIGVGITDIEDMLAYLGVTSLDELINKTVPDSIRLQAELQLPPFAAAASEFETLQAIRSLAKKNIVYRTYVGLGYYNCIVPSVIQRNVFENPCWYTQYTPYQPEIAQGRLEALINFQTMVSELAGLPIANASLLDEATAVAEGIAMAYAVVQKKNAEANKIVLDDRCFPQTIAVVKTRAEALGLTVQVCDITDVTHYTKDTFAIVLQYPAADGAIINYTEIITTAKSKGIFAIVAADLLALTLLKPPGEMGADVVVGNSQRFGVPPGFGGPHAAFFATREEYKRIVPGRIVGASRDKFGTLAYRLALQTREQHIRREKATSNICTAQVLLAIMASMYAVYHGPEGLKRIARRVQSYAERFAHCCINAGLSVPQSAFFDTVEVVLSDAVTVRKRLTDLQINVHWESVDKVRIAFDETVTENDFADIVFAITGEQDVPIDGQGFASIPSVLLRQSSFLDQPVFHSYHSETEFLRYVRRLESRDLSLATSMIPLGSCTMKLNATTEMIPVGWSEFNTIHPYVPEAQVAGYTELCSDLEQALVAITGLAAVSLQPNAGSQGEYAGLLAIKAYHNANNQSQRTICLIPRSAHGTNPASAVMAGLQVVVVNCDDSGNISEPDLFAKVEQYGETLAALMVTYPSTHGVFETTIKDICQKVHSHGGQVYMDGANLNAPVGLSSPGVLGADVVHINLHKTFCIPHGGGGPGMGPIAVASHLSSFLPGNPLSDTHSGAGPVSAARYGSASILPISWMYIALMGARGLTFATRVAILNANYMAARLSKYCPVLYKGAAGFVAHECILDVRHFKKAGIEVEDIAKRLMDYGFHAPTVSFPVPGTLMIEPTESESRAEIDLFCDALISIFEEIKQVETGEMPVDNNPLKNAPHPVSVLARDVWDYPYSRITAAFPMPHLLQYKFWPSVARIDGVYGDRNLVCTCPDISTFE